MPAKNPIEVGTRFQRLTVLSVEYARGKSWCRCMCECGTEVRVRQCSLKRGDSGSCGCLRSELHIAKRTKHGMYGKPTHNSWRRMMGRCTDPKNNKFMEYGGRGIMVCKQWQKFDNFLADMGQRPEGMTLDRMDPNKGYEPGNCRWATASQQAQNKRAFRRLTLNGESLTVLQWSKKLGMPRATIYVRLKRGCSVQEALSPAL